MIHTCNASEIFFIWTDLQRFLIFVKRLLSPFVGLRSKCISAFSCTLMSVNIRSFLSLRFQIIKLLYLLVQIGPQATFFIYKSTIQRRMTFFGRACTKHYIKREHEVSWDCLSNVTAEITRADTRSKDAKEASRISKGRNMIASTKASVVPYETQWLKRNQIVEPPKQ